MLQLESAKLKTAIPRFPAPKVNVSAVSCVDRSTRGPNEACPNEARLSAAQGILSCISGSPSGLPSESPGGLVRAAHSALPPSF